MFNCGGSCPVLYVWDGEQFEFGTDLNGPGKLATKSSAGYFRPNPHDYYVLGVDPVETRGHYEMRLVEERFEVDYLDTLKLYAVDVPDDRDVYAEKPSFSTPFEGLEHVLHTVDTNLSPPVSATLVNTGEDISGKIADSDGNYLILSSDRNNDFDYHTIELDLGDVSQAPQIKLIIDGFTAFPNTPEGTGRSKKFGPRTKIEVLDKILDMKGQWVSVWVSVPKKTAILPKLPEFRRRFVFDITDIFLTNAYRVRLTFLFKTYIDSIHVDTTADEPVVLTPLQLVSAKLRSYGQSDEIQLIDDIYEYVYNLDSPNHEHQYFPGDYTRYGQVKQLLSDVDDLFVIFGQGDEIALKFNPLRNQPPDGNRRFLIYTNSYYKDAKTDVPRTVEPLPFADMSNYPYDEALEHYPDDSEHNHYREKENTRTVP
jgi:hypothetical protein